MTTDPRKARKARVMAVIMDSGIEGGPPPAHSRTWYAQQAKKKLAEIRQAAADAADEAVAPGGISLEAWQRERTLESIREHRNQGDR